MNTTETLIDTVDHSLKQLADGEAALLSAQTSQGKYTETTDMLVDRVGDIVTIAHHVADLAAKVGIYVDSGNSKLTAAGNTLGPTAVGTESPMLLSALSHTTIARNELGGPQEAAQGCVEHAGTRLQTIQNLLGSLTREVTALQQEAGNTSTHIAEATSATQVAKQSGEEYLDSIFGGRL